MILFSQNDFIKKKVKESKNLFSFWHLVKMQHVYILECLMYCIFDILDLCISTTTWSKY
jgi:hypothetical protein